MGSFLGSISGDFLEPSTALSPKSSKSTVFGHPFMRDQPRAGCPGNQPRASVLRMHARTGLSSKVGAKAVRRKKHPSPVKRSFGGKPTTSVGLASSLDRNYRVYVKHEIRARWLESSVGSGRLKAGVDGDQKQLQEELDHCRLKVKLSLERFYAAEAAMKKGAFAKVDIEEALSKTTRDPSTSLSLPVKKLKRIEFSAISNTEAEDSSSIE